MLIAFEGLDQSGKETQAQQLRERLREAGHKVRLLSFPDYGTSIGEEIARALQGEREYGPDVMQLLFVANRHERREAILEWIAGGLILLCDRYRASSIAYGEAQGLDARWLERHPALSAACRPHDLHRHRARNGGRNERRTIAIATSATSHCSTAFAQATGARPTRISWIRIDGERSKEAIAEEVFAAVTAHLNDRD